MMKLVVLVAGDSVRGIGVVATRSVVCAGLCFLGQEAQGSDHGPSHGEEASLELRRALL